MTTEAEKIKEEIAEYNKLKKVDLLSAKEIIRLNEIPIRELQAKLSQYKSDLQQELKFLKDLWIKGYGTAYDSPRVFLEARINLIEKELEIIENGK